MEKRTYLDNFFGHLHTINKHKFLVTKMCLKAGLVKQGLLHDLSKYSFSEFWPSVKYFQGDKSPITYEKKLKGYSDCWLHHKGRNKHHWEYWTDRIGNELISIEMPFNYVLECVIDKIAASKVYKKDEYTTDYPVQFFNDSYEIHIMNKKTARQIYTLLDYLKNNGEDKTIVYIKQLYKNWKKDNKFEI